MGVNDDMLNMAFLQHIFLCDKLLLLLLFVLINPYKHPLDNNTFLCDLKVGLNQNQITQHKVI